MELYFGLAVIAIILLVGFWGMTHGLGEATQKLEAAVEEDKRAHQRLVNVAGANSWSSDDRHVRLQQLKRRKERLELAFLPDIQQLDEIADAILILERNIAREHIDNTSPDTIIGFER